MAFEVGDVVMLKSGGPMMTIDSTDFEEGKVRCVWMNLVSDNNYSTSVQVFPSEVLELAADVAERVKEHKERVSAQRSARFARMNRG